jgi:hypothetical protein
MPLKEIIHPANREKITTPSSDGNPKVFMCQKLGHRGFSAFPTAVQPV